MRGNTKAGPAAGVSYVVTIALHKTIFQHKIRIFITKPSIYGVIVVFLLCHESLNYSTGH